MLSLHLLGGYFIAYFRKYRAQIIKETMTAHLRSMASLGWPLDVYDQNGNECMNSVLQEEKQVLKDFKNSRKLAKNRGTSCIHWP